MKEDIKRFWLAFLVYTVTSLCMTIAFANLAPDGADGFFAIVIILCMFGIPCVAAYFVLRLYGKRHAVALIPPPQAVETPEQAVETPTQVAETPTQAVEKPAIEDNSRQFIRLRQYREKLQAYAETLRGRAVELAEREGEFDEREKSLNAYEQKLKNQENQILSVSRAIRTEEQMERYEQELNRLERRVFDWVKLRERDEKTAFEELRKKVEVFIKAQDTFQGMTGLEFEQYFSALLEKNGYACVEVTKKTGDFGADVIATLDGVKYVFQCKYYSSPVGIEAVYQIHAAKTMYSAHVAVVATNSVFTKPAQIAAEELKVILWDGEKLSQLAKNSTIL